MSSLVAITALSLVTMPADAAEKRSSDISGNQGIGYAYDEYYEAKPWVRELMKGTATEQSEKLHTLRLSSRTGQRTVPPGPQLTF